VLLLFAALGLEILLLFHVRRASNLTEVHLWFTADGYRTVALAINPYACPLCFQRLPAAGAVNVTAGAANCGLGEAVCAVDWGLGSIPDSGIAGKTFE